MAWLTQAGAFRQCGIFQVRDAALGTKVARQKLPRHTHTLTHSAQTRCVQTHARVHKVGAHDQERFVFCVGVFPCLKESFAWK
jgi:ABC-type nickel/cobalt efflux system permease component RcnA